MYALLSRVWCEWGVVWTNAKFIDAKVCIATVLHCRSNNKAQRCGISLITLDNTSGCTMSSAYSSIPCLVCASFFMAACFPLYLCTMSYTNSSPDNSIGASFMAANFFCIWCTMPYTNSSLDGIVCTFFIAATPCLIQTFPFWSCNQCLPLLTVTTLD